MTLCPPLKQKETRREFNAIVVRLGGKPLSEIDSVNRPDYSKSLSEPQLAAYHAAYALWDRHSGNATEAMAHLDALDRVRAALAGEIPETLENRVEDRSGERGSVSTAFVEPLNDAITEAAGIVSSARDDLLKVFAPAGRGGVARPTAEMVRQRAAELQRSIDQVEYALKATRKMFAKMPVPERYKFIDDMELGNPQPSTELQTVADVFRQILDDDRDQVKALGTGKLENIIDNYYPRYWDKGKRRSPASEGRSKRPLEGSKSFLKKRSYEFFMDGIDAGETPLSDNPVDFVLWKHAEMMKYVKAHENLNELKGDGIAKFASNPGKAPAGWVTPDDNLFAVWQRGDKGELIMRGHYYMPEEGAKIFNNYLSKGIRDKKWFSSYLAISNLMNQFQLGFSFFHAGFVTLDAIISNNTLAAYQVAHGNPGKAMLTLGQSLFAPIIYQRIGRKMRQEWRESGRHPGLEPIMDAWVAGGGRSNMDNFYQTHIGGKIVDAFREGIAPGLKAIFKPSLSGVAFGAAAGGMLGGPIGAVAGGFLGSGAGRALFTLAEVGAWPLMHWFVPNMKAGAVAKMAEYELFRLGPNATQEQIRHKMAQVVDSVDNRMGQLIYDNLFWNKTAKDLGMATVRSLGWNLGDLREFIGGILDWLKLPHRIAAAGLRRFASGGAGGSGSGGGRPPRGPGNVGAGASNPNQGPGSGGIWEVPPPEFTPRMFYPFALVTTVGILGGLLTYLLTGERPKELKDYFYSRTGNLDEQGDPERIQFASYMKDILPFVIARGLKGEAKAALSMAAHKLHPMLNTIAQMLMNEDYFGTEIRHADDPIVRQAQDELKYVGKQFVPFGIEGVIRERERGATWGKALLPEIGITPAPKSINQTAAQQMMSEILASRRPAGTRTREQAQIGQLKAAISRGMRKGGDQATAAHVRLADAINSGVISKEEAKKLETGAGEQRGTPQFKELGIADAINVYESGTAKEKTDWKQALEEKEPLIEGLPENERDAVRARFSKALGAVEDSDVTGRIKRLRESSGFQSMNPGEKKAALRGVIQSLKKRPQESEAELELLMQRDSARDAAKEKMAGRRDFQALPKQAQDEALRSLAESFNRFDVPTGQRKQPEDVRTRKAEMQQRMLERFNDQLLDRHIELIIRKVARRAA